MTNYKQLTLHSPTAILHEGKICLKYWETEKPIMTDVINGYLYNKAHADWLNSAKIVPFGDQEAAKKEVLSCVGFENYGIDPIPLDSIADRIRVVEPDKSGTTQFESFVVIQPLTHQTMTKEEKFIKSKGLTNSILEIYSDGKKMYLSDIISEYSSSLIKENEELKKQNLLLSETVLDRERHADFLSEKRTMLQETCDSCLLEIKELKAKCEKLEIGRHGLSDAIQDYKQKLSDEVLKNKSLKLELDKLESKVKELEEKATWIPISERLPECGRSYLFYSGGIIITLFYQEPDHFYHQENKWCSEITHWMPLPKCLSK